LFLEPFSLSGVAVKPVIGISDLVSRTTEGISQSTSAVSALSGMDRIRPPRYVNRQDRILKEYDLKKSVGQEIFYNINYGEFWIQNDYYLFYCQFDIKDLTGLTQPMDANAPQPPRRFFFVSARWVVFASKPVNVLSVGKQYQCDLKVAIEKLRLVLVDRNCVRIKYEEDNAIMRDSLVLSPAMYFPSPEKALKVAHKISFWLRAFAPVVVADSSSQPSPQGRGAFMMQTTSSGTLQRNTNNNSNSMFNTIPSNRGSLKPAPPQLPPQPCPNPSPAMMHQPTTSAQPQKELSTLDPLPLPNPAPFPLPNTQQLQPPTRPAPNIIDAPFVDRFMDKFLAGASDVEKELYRQGMVPTSFNWREALEQRERERNKIHSIKMTIAKDRYIAHVTFNAPTLEGKARDPAVFVLKEGEYVVSVKSWCTEAIERLVFTTSAGRLCSGGNEKTNGKQAEVSGEGLVGLNCKLGTEQIFYASLVLCGFFLFVRFLFFFSFFFFFFFFLFEIFFLKKFFKKFRKFLKSKFLKNFI
jgi:hypothetical protein